VVLAPVWVSPYGLVNYLLPAQWPGPVFSHLSDPNDAAILPRMAPNYVVVPLLCSSWVNPDWYEPVPFEKKDIDIFMLANFGKYKRHFLLFKALRRLPRSTRVLLIGQHNAGRTRETLMAEARAYGVEGRFELEENATDSEVFSAFARAKTSLILSRREGSCIAVVESIMANTPVGLLANAEVGSRIFINEQTGRFLQEKNLAEQLADFIANAGKYSPRQWALANNIHCRGSSAILNEIIKRTVLAGGGQWTQDIAPFQWRPAPVPIKAEDKARLQAERREIYERFGIQIGREPLK
jgi:glycosyltransferase involved in cell wall biosynthesis